MYKSSCIKRTLLTLLSGIMTFTASAQPAKETIAVYHFTSATGYSYDYALGVGNAIEAGILRSNRFTVVERTRFGHIKEEDKFKEANTSEIVNRASKFGAKTLVTGHVVGVSHGEIVSSGRPTGREYIEISVSFKILDIGTSQIMKSEIIRGKGEGQNRAEALQNAYLVLDRLSRAHIGSYLPQAFKLMSIEQTETRKNEEVLRVFKIWGGSKDGLMVDDVIDINYVTYLTNPNTGEKVAEKQLLGQAKIDAVNGESTATCSLLNYKKTGGQILKAMGDNPESISLEYKGIWHEKRSWADLLGD